LLSSLTGLRRNVAEWQRPSRTRLLLIGTFTFLLAVAGLWLLWDRLLFPGSRDGQLSLSAAKLAARIESGEQALHQGEFARAANELALAVSAVQGQPDSLSAEQRRRLRQLHRQAGLLADWPGEPLDHIIARSMPLKDDEWAVIVGRYRGKGIVFDLELRVDLAGRGEVKPTRRTVLNLVIQLDNLKLLQWLPLDVPQRVVFGARLADVRRDGPDSCVVGVDPDSGVLLTDVAPGVLRPILSQTDAARILTEQRQWLGRLP
jgi:hypothetical protein